MSSRLRRIRKEREGTKRVWLRVLTVVVASVVGLTVLGATAGLAYVGQALQGMPDPDKPGAFRIAKPTKIYSADGKLLANFFLENREVVKLSQISTELANAVVAVEDHRFYRHPGIAPIGVGRAVVRDIRGGGRREGGSTLTQQLARTIFLSNVKTFGRKIKEGGIALLIEAQLSKKQILEFYLNRVYLSAGVYGVETMSQHLFRKPARNVTLPEAAFIAGLIRAPSALSPWSNYDGALRRSHLVLSQMRAQNFITADAEAAALRVRPSIQPSRPSPEGMSGWAKDYLRPPFPTGFRGHPPPCRPVPGLESARKQATAHRPLPKGRR